MLVGADLFKTAHFCEKSVENDFKRIKTTDKTEALMRAVELADDCDFLLILYQGKEGSSLGNGFIHAGETTLCQLNWYLDRFKLWLHG